MEKAKELLSVNKYGKKRTFCWEDLSSSPLALYGDSCADICRFQIENPNPNYGEFLLEQEEELVQF